MILIYTDYVTQCVCFSVASSLNATIAISIFGSVALTAVEVFLTYKANDEHKKFTRLVLLSIGLVIDLTAPLIAAFLQCCFDFIQKENFTA